MSASTLMKLNELILISYLALGHSFAGEQFPSEPTPAQIATLFNVEAKLVSKGRWIEGRVTKETAKWVATYEISGKERWALEIILFPKDRMQRFSYLSSGSSKEHESEIKEATAPDGDVIVHRYANVGGDAGSKYFAEIINHEKDWDFAIYLARANGVDVNKFPIAEIGFKLIPKIEKLLRDQKKPNNHKKQE